MLNCLAFRLGFVIFSGSLDKTLECHTWFGGGHEVGPGLLDLVYQTIFNQTSRQIILTMSMNLSWSLVADLALLPSWDLVSELKETDLRLVLISFESDETCLM